MINADIKNNNSVMLHDMAQKYADHHFPLPADGKVCNDMIKHDVAFHSYCDGFNAALRFLMNIRNLSDPCYHHGDDPNFD